MRARSAGNLGRVEAAASLTTLSVQKLRVKAMIDSVRFQRLSRLASDFSGTAETYAKLIISELCLPNDRKTIQPADLGGFAGIFPC